MPYARDRTWYTVPKQGNPKLVWLYAVGIYGPLHSMNRISDGQMYVFNRKNSSIRTSVPTLRRLKVIP